MSSFTRARSSEEFKKRLNLLVHGFVRLYDFIPSEIVCIISNLYCSLHFQWSNRNVTLQFVNHKAFGDQRLYFLGETGGRNRSSHSNYRYSSEFDRRIIDISSNAEYRHAPWRRVLTPYLSPVWRMDPLSNPSNGFTLRPLNVTETEDVVQEPNCPYLGRDGIATRDNALSLQLVRPDDAVDDEYYIQNADNDKYLVVEHDTESIHASWSWQDHLQNWHFCPAGIRNPGSRERCTTLHFEDSPSEATMFRIKECGPSFDAALDLRIGSRVSYKSDYDAEVGGHSGRARVKARVIDLDQNAFGRRVKLKCDGIGYVNYDRVDPVRIDMETDWIPAESPLIRDYILRDRHSQFAVDEWNRLKKEQNERERLWEEQYEERQREELAKKQLEEKRVQLRIQKKGEIGDFKVAFCEPPQVIEVSPIYEKRVKSRDKTKQKKRKRKNHRNWNGKCNDKRIERKTRKYGLYY